MSLSQTSIFMVASLYLPFTIIGARNSNTRELPAPGVIRSKISLRRQAGLHAEHHGFGGGDVVDGDQKVGDVFHLAAIAEGADVVDLAAEGVEHRLQSLDQAGIAAGVEDQVARLRPASRCR